MYYHGECSTSHGSNDSRPKPAKNVHEESNNADGKKSRSARSYGTNRNCSRATEHVMHWPERVPHWRARAYIFGSIARGSPVLLPFNLCKSPALLRRYPDLGRRCG